ncbi:MAG TPA: hypothetical protein VMB21_11975 [Candidatus Limnocylindria bacterium]|jgi:hypothetical protein|nr:hypothetical protein [Candidatus Limnocylindria bacterium]
MTESFKRWLMLPGVVSFFYSLYGVLWLRWSVADLYFWFWFDFVLTGLTTIGLTWLWLRAHREVRRDQSILTLYILCFSFVMMLIFASIFAGMAFYSEWKDWGRFPEFLAARKAGLFQTVVAAGLYCAGMIWGRRYAKQEANSLEMPLARKAGIVLALYALMLLHGWIREWTTGTKLNVTPTYLKGMGVTLITLKLLVDLGVADRIFKRRMRARTVPPKTAEA